MASETTRLSIAPREPGSSRATRRLRREGQVPGVLYGGTEEPVAFAVDALVLRRALAATGAVVELEIDGDVAAGRPQGRPAPPGAGRDDARRLRARAPRRRDPVDGAARARRGGEQPRRARGRDPRAGRARGERRGAAQRDPRRRPARRQRARDRRHRAPVGRAGAGGRDARRRPARSSSPPSSSPRSTPRPTRPPRRASSRRRSAWARTGADAEAGETPADAGDAQSE